MALSEELAGISQRATAFAEPGEELVGIVSTEPAVTRIYLCAYAGADGETSWVALDADGEPVESLTLVRESVTIAAMCEVAEEVAAGSDLDELRSQLVSLRMTESPPGIAEAEDAALALQAAIGAPPRVATPGHLDTVGAATRRLERALDDRAGSAFAEAMKHAVGSVERLVQDVLTHYKRELR